VHPTTAFIVTICHFHYHLHLREEEEEIENCSGKLVLEVIIYVLKILFEKVYFGTYFTYFGKFIS